MNDQWKGPPLGGSGFNEWPIGPSGMPFSSEKSPPLGGSGVARDPEAQAIADSVMKNNPLAQSAATRQFSTGATRDVDTNKLDFEGFLSPLALEAFAKYMNINRSMKDGSTRASDNWQKGMPLDVYMKSGWRHFFDWWQEHRGIDTDEGLVIALCAVMFNAQGYLHETLKANPDLLDIAMQAYADQRAREQGRDPGNWRP